MPRTFTVGQRLSATVASLPDAKAGAAARGAAGRLLLHVPLSRAGGAPGRAAADSPAGEAGAAGKAAGSAGGKGVRVDLTPGSVVEAVVTAVQPNQLDVLISVSLSHGLFHSSPGWVRDR